MKNKRMIKKILWFCILAFLGFIFAFPFFWMTSTSLKTYDEIFMFPPPMLPEQPQWSNYADLMTELPFLQYTLNTVFVTGFTLLGFLISSPIIAFGFSYFKFPGKKWLFRLLLVTMMLPPQVTMIPQFVLFNKLGWVGSFKPLIIPTFFGGSYVIFLLKQFFDTVPREFSDAAKIDGASSWNIFSKIYLPLSKPAIATSALFVFMWTWTDFLNPLIYLTDDRMYTLSIGLQQLSTSRATAWPQLMAGSVLMTLPIIILFFVAQNKFVKGINIGGVKA